MARLNLLIF